MFLDVLWWLARSRCRPRHWCRRRRSGLLTTLNKG
jgi:hypothetical protein